MLILLFKKSSFVCLFLVELSLHCCDGFTLVVSGAAFCCGLQASPCSSFSRCREASRLSSCGSQAVERRPSRCGTCVYCAVASGIFPQLRDRTVSPASAGRFFTTEPPGKPAASPFPDADAEVQRGLVTFPKLASESQRHTWV